MGSQNQSVNTMPSFIIWNKNKRNFKDDFDAILKSYAGCIYNSTKIGEFDYLENLNLETLNRVSEGILEWKVRNLVQRMNGVATREEIGLTLGFFSDKPIKQFDIT